MLARDYLTHFGDPPRGNGHGGDDLRARRLQLLGESRGQITRTELAHALAAYQTGTADALVAIVSGETAPEVRTEILAAVEHGEIEAVFNVDVWYEGADLYMFTHLLGARPTFSRVKKAQERGRVNRRGPTEVSAAGVLQRDPPKLCYDVIDNYHSFTRQLITYGIVMGVQGYTGIPEATLFDAMTEAAATNVDRTGKDATHTPIGAGPVRLPPPRPSPEALGTASWAPLIEQLWEVAASRYGGDLDSMALDLGLPLEALRALLAGQGWINMRWFLRRLATLLYQDRESLVRRYNDARELGDDRVTSADIDLLRRALAVYTEWEGEIAKAVVIEQGVMPSVPATAITPTAVQALSRGTLTDLAWRNLWHGLFRYFEKMSESPEPTERTGEAWTWSVRLLQEFFVREKWPQEPADEGEALRYHARELVARRYGGMLPHDPGMVGVPSQDAASSLTRWLAGDPMRYSQSLPPSVWYAHVRALLLGLGEPSAEVETLITAAIFAERGWPSTQVAFYQAIEDLKREGPRPLGWQTKCLKGEYQGAISLRIDYRHRMIYEVFSGVLTIMVLQVTARKNAY